MAHWKLTIQATRRHILEGEKKDAERYLEQLRADNPDWTFQQSHISEARPSDLNPNANEHVARSSQNWRRLPRD